MLSICIQKIILRFVLTETKKNVHSCKTQFLLKQFELINLKPNSFFYLVTDILFRQYINPKIKHKFVSILLIMKPN